jgi:hypothetical protein
MNLGQEHRAMAIPKRFRLSVHVGLTLISFVTTGRAPRLVAFGARDLATIEKRVGTDPGETALLKYVEP